MLWTWIKQGVKTMRQAERSCARLICLVALLLPIAALPLHVLLAHEEHEHSAFCAGHHGHHDFEQGASAGHPHSHPHPDRAVQSARFGWKAAGASGHDACDTCDILRARIATRRDSVDALPEVVVLSQALSLYTAPCARALVGEISPRAPPVV